MRGDDSPRVKLNGDEFPASSDESIDKALILINDDSGEVISVSVDFCDI